MFGWEAKIAIEEMCQDTWRWQSNNPDGYRVEKLGLLQATVDFALKRPELREDFIEFLKTKSDDMER